MPDTQTPSIVETQRLGAERLVALPITGMTCANCSRAVGRALSAVPGVTAAEVNIASERAEIRGTAKVGDLITAVRRAGYDVASDEARLHITGMTCASCATRVTAALQTTPGVTEASVNPASGIALVRMLRGTPLATLDAAVQRAGYGVARTDQAAPVADRSWVAPLVAALLTAPLLLGMAGMVVGQDWMPHPWVQFALATPVQFILGARFYRAGFRAIRAGAANMDVLVALGTSAAYALSVWTLLKHGAAHAHALYFEASAVVILFVLVGKWLEARARRATGSAIAALLALRPATARVLVGGEERDITPEALREGDVLVVRPGERIAADGTIFDGIANIDESALTGESRAMARGVGEAVHQGAIVLDGRLLVTARAIGGQTLLARVAALVEAAQASRAPVQKLVDRVSAIFVPAVLGIAALTLVGWLVVGAGMETALLHAVAVLVIACPCALGLATPAAIMTGTGAAARAGILIRDAEAIERASGITLVAFDKTGTLTEGRPRLAAKHGDADGLRLAAALNAGSEHPLARAFLVALGEAPPPASQFRALPGRGVEGVV
ncbi:MAG: heavy metal translocating P-type ATPase, partial [Pseudomonadota bacterium]